MSEGLKTAVELALGATPGLAPGPEPEQIPLLPLPLAEAGAGDQVAGERGRGRPRGARNKRTEEWVDYLLRRYRSPLEGLFETFSRSVDDLARELACDKLEAFTVQRICMEAALPYVHQKLPAVMELNSRGVVALTIGVSGEAQAMMDQAAGDAPTVISGQVIEVQPDQGVSDDKAPGV